MSNLLFWVIENEVAIECGETTNGLIVRYEDICLRPRTELQKIGCHLNVDIPEQIFERIQEASWSSRQSVTSMTPEERIHRWKNLINDEQTEWLSQVLQRSKLSEHYGLDSLRK